MVWIVYATGDFSPMLQAQLQESWMIRLYGDDVPSALAAEPGLVPLFGEFTGTRNIDAVFNALPDHAKA